MKNEIIKIAITGPESTGKSDLTKALAAYFNEPFAIEYAREYLEKTTGKYSLNDLEEICKGQIEIEEAAIEKADNLCFFDTEMLVLKIWSEFRFGKTPEIIEKNLLNRKYDFYLLCSTDLPWENDILRESPQKQERDLLFSIYQKHLEKLQARYAIIQGTGEQRFENALKVVEGFLSGSKSWKF